MYGEAGDWGYGRHDGNSMASKQAREPQSEIERVRGQVGVTGVTGEREREREREREERTLWRV